MHTHKVGILGSPWCPLKNNKWTAAAEISWRCSAQPTPAGKRFQVLRVSCDKFPTAIDYSQDSQLVCGQSCKFSCQNLFAVRADLFVVPPCVLETARRDQCGCSVFDMCWREYVHGQSLSGFFFPFFLYRTIFLRWSGLRLAARRGSERLTFFWSRNPFRALLKRRERSCYTDADLQTKRKRSWF